MKAYHGTSQENKNSILNFGFRFDTELHKGKLFGDAIYFTTRREHAKNFGNSIIEVEIDVENFMFIYEKEEYDDFFDYFVRDALSPYNSIEEYVFEKFIASKQKYEELSCNELSNLLNPIFKSAEYIVGTAIRTHLITEGYNSLGLLMGDADIDYYELTVYDKKLIKILS